MRRQGLGSFGMLSLWLVLFALPAVSDSDDYNPFRIPKAEFFGSVRTVGLWPIIMPSDLADREQVRLEVEQRLTDRLESLGLVVIPSFRIEQRWNELSSLVGGTFDAVTGEADSQKLGRVKDILFREFALGDGVDAFIQPRISIGAIGIWAKNLNQSPPEGGQAKSYTAWMAAHEPTFWRGKPVHSRWEYRPTRAIGPRLGLSMRDPAEIELYNVMVPIRHDRIYMNGGYDDRPESSLLDHLDRIEVVIETLTENLVQEDDATSP